MPGGEHRQSKETRMTKSLTPETITYQTIRQMFKDWDSLKALGQHPLSRLHVVEQRQQASGYTASPAGRGLALREVLTSALEQLKPANTPPDPAERSWRPYLILSEQLVNGRSPEWVAAQLHISRGTYFLEQKRALEIVADTLHKWEEKSRNTPADAPPLSPPAIPFLAPPRPTQPVIGHAEILGTLKQHLLNGATIALNGLPGVGKTTLAIELAHHPGLAKHFVDGILWVGLGRQPDVLALLGGWAAALGLSAQAIASYANITERAAAVRSAIGLKRMLLVIDDAWQVEAGLAFKVGGPNCAHVLTTRLSNVALDFAGDKVIKINELELGHGLNLLAHFTPRLVEFAPAEAERLVRSVGGLPLALILMGGYLRKQSYNAQSRRVAQALTQLQNAEDRLRLSRPQSPVEAHPALPFETPLSLQAMIGLNEAFLAPTARQSLRDLSLFEPKPNTFSETAALAVISGSPTDLDQLVDHGLVESVAFERYTMHQTIADYAALQGPAGPASERYIAYFIRFITDQAADFAALDGELANLVNALDRAIAADADELFLKGIAAIYPFLETRGLYPLLERFLNHAAAISEAANDRPGLAQNWYNLGEINVKRGDFAAAKTHLLKSLQLARLAKLPLIEADSLFQLGLSCWYAAGNAAGGTADIERALAVYRQSGCKENEGYALNGLGFIHQELGNYDRAIFYLKQALTVGRENGLTRVEGWAHFNLGQVYLPIGDFYRAKDHYLECLQRYRQLGDLRGEGWLIYNLGRFYRKVGDYEQARASSEQALEILAGIGDKFGMGFAIHNLGLIAFEQGLDAAAVAHYERALSVFKGINCLTGWSQTCHSLGLRLRRHGDYTAARRYFEQALQMRRDINYNRGESMTLANMGLVFHYLGDDSAALLYCQQALGIARELGAKPTLAYVLTLYGHVLAGLGRLADAAEVYLQALVLRRELGQPHLTLDPLAGLADVFLAEGNLPQATTYVNKILSHLPPEQNSSNPISGLVGADDPARILRVCQAVLRAGDDSRAALILPAATAFAGAKAEN